jgi:hypothetical protein
MQQRSREHFNLLRLLGCNFNNFNNLITSASTRLKLPEDHADASKHVAVLMAYKNIINICCAFVGLDNKKSNFKDNCATHCPNTGS